MSVQRSRRAFFNRFSLVRLHWDAKTCTHCDKCLEVCPMEIKVYEGENTGHCIRCLDCTACEAINVTTAFSQVERQPEPLPETATS